jgi:hypothetical protein
MENQVPARLGLFIFPRLKSVACCPYQDRRPGILWSCPFFHRFYLFVLELLIAQAPADNRKRAAPHSLEIGILFNIDFLFNAGFDPLSQGDIAYQSLLLNQLSFPEVLLNAVENLLLKFIPSG